MMVDMHEWALRLSSIAQHYSACTSALSGGLGSITLEAEGKHAQTCVFHVLNIMSAISS